MEHHEATTMQDATTDSDKLAMIKRIEGAMASLRERFPDLFGGISMQTVTEYSCLATAMSRSELAQEQGAICTDAIAGKICGEEGEALVQVSKALPSFGSFEARAYMSLRSYFADYTMQSRHESIHQIVMLGAGIDTRAFRLPEVADCCVFEIDGGKLIQEFKQRRINELKLPLIAKQRQVLAMNLADPSWPDKLLELGFNPKEPTFWLLEGFLMYLTGEQNEVLLTSIDKLSAPNSELFCDMCGGDKYVNQTIASEDRQRQYGQDHELLKSLPWFNDVVLERNPDFAYSGSLWDATKFQNFILKKKEDAMYGSFFFSWLKKKQVAP